MDPDQLASFRSQLIWIFTLLQIKIYLGSAREELNYAGRGVRGLKLLILTLQLICRLQNESCLVCIRPKGNNFHYNMKKLPMKELNYNIKQQKKNHLEK